MSHQYNLHEQVRAMFSAKYFCNSPQVRETESGDIIVSTDISIGTNDDERLLKVTMQLRCKPYGIVARTILHLNAPVHTYKQVVDFITQINSKKPFSCLEFDYNDGEIAARSYLQCSDYVPSAETIYTMIYDTNSAFMEHGDQLLKLLEVDSHTLEKVNESEALDVLDEALKGNSNAQNLLIEIIGRDPESNYYSRLKEAAHSGNEQAQVLLYKCTSDQSNFESALTAAKDGDIEAQCYVGLCYQTGKDNAPIDHEQATMWMETAAKAGSADALCYLGIRIFAEGQKYGSEEEGVRYLTLAAEKGNALAQYHLGDFYWAGDYVRQNQNEAIMWYEKSAQQNNADAQFKLGLIHHSDEYGYQDPQKAALWFERAAEQGNVLAQRQTAVNYLMGNGVDENTKKAQHWIEKAALQGDEKAISTLREYWPSSSVLAEINQKSEGQSSQQSESSHSSAPSGGCYIATCVYGSYDCPQVWTLRRYRDDYLAEYSLGRLFIRCYYAVSPKLVKLLGDCTLIRNFWKSLLDKMVNALNEEGYLDTPYEDKTWMH